MTRKTKLSKYIKQVSSENILANGAPLGLGYKYIWHDALDSSVPCPAGYVCILLS